MVKFPSLKEIFVGTILTFFLVQIISVIISSIFPSIPQIRGGMAILLLLVLIGMIALYNIAFDLQKFGKEQLIFVLIVFGLIALAFWKGQTYFPDLFSIAPDISYSIKQTIGSIISP